MKLGLQILPSGGQRVSDEDAVRICQMTQKGQLAHPSEMAEDQEKGETASLQRGSQPMRVSGTSLGSGPTNILHCE